MYFHVSAPIFYLFFYSPLISLHFMLQLVQELEEASTASTTEKSLEDKPEPQEGKLNKTQQLKKVFKEYGAVGVSFHIGISLVSLGMFYLLVSR